MNNFLAIWEDTTPGVRASFIVAVCCIIAVAVAAMLWVAKQEYSTLFAELETRDAAALVAELDRLKIDYKLAQDGTQVMVPSEEVHKIRLQLMDSGVPFSGGVGFEIFDNSDFGMTEFAQQINYKRALEGELTRTIMSLKSVKYARVHLVMPEKGLFQAETETPSASVTLFYRDSKLERHQALDDQQIKGVQRLVSAAVPKLSPEAVTVTDQNGVTLTSSTPTNKAMAALSARLEQKQALEEYLSAKLNGVLSRTFGDGRARASVDVELDFNETTTTTENVLAPVSEGDNIVRKRETRQGSGKSDPDGGNLTTDTEYRLGRTVQKIVETPGRIQRLNVAVVVPDATSSINLEEIKRLVAASIGLDDARGDEVVVYRVPEQSLENATPADVFDATTLQTDKTAEVQNSQSQTTTQLLLGAMNGRWIIAGGAVFAILILLLLLPVAGRKRRLAALNATPSLSEKDRAATLARLQTWLETENGLDGHLDEQSVET